MTIYCFGSINIDHIYRVPRIPAPGETLSASAVSQTLGGKGANTSIALARAGAEICHIGCIAQADQDNWVLREMAKAGVDVRFVQRVAEPTGHAIVHVAEDGENAITLFRGANGANDLSHITTSLETAKRGEWFVLQNETNLCVEAAKEAKSLGLKVAYVAAPFELTTVLQIIQDVDLIAMNEHEAAQLERALGVSVEDADLPDALITLGERGAKYVAQSKAPILQAAQKVEDIRDTTCAGDTFFGFFLSRYANGGSVEASMRLATAAASLAIQKSGATSSIPTLKEAEAQL